MARLIITDKLPDFDGNTIVREEHEIHGTLYDWFVDKCPSFDNTKKLPFECQLNGKEFDINQQLIKSDVVHIQLEPKAPAVPWIILAVTVASAAYSYYVAKNIDVPDTQNLQRSSQGSGTSIYSATARANDPRPNQSIRSIAGQIDIYPDYLITPYQRFINNKEIRYMMLSLGEGYFDYDQGNVFLSETPLLRYAGDYKIDLYEPNDDVTGSLAHEFWYQTKEVSGLRLSSNDELEYGTYTADFSGAQITSYFEGSPSEFPFDVGTYFEIKSPINVGWYRVTALSGTNSSIATVVKIIRASDKLPAGTLNFLNNLNSGYKPPVADPNYWTDDGAPTFTATTGTLMDWQSLRDGKNWEGPFVLTPEGQLADEFEIDFKFVQGLAERNSDGTLADRTLEVALEYRNYGDTSWIEHPIFSWTENTIDQLGFTVRIKTDDRIRPEIRLRRVTPDATDERIYDIVDVIRVKAKLDIQGRYPEISTIALEIVGTDGLAATSSNRVNIRAATRKLPTLQEIQNLSWDLRDAQTKNDNRWTYANTNYIGSVEDVKRVKGQTLSYTDPCVSFSADGQYMTVSLAEKYARQYRLSKPFDPLSREANYKNPTLMWDYQMNGNAVRDTIMRSGMDGTNKYSLVLYDGTFEVVENKYRSVVGSIARDGVIDVAPNTEFPGKVFYFLNQGAVQFISFSTAWDLTTQNNGGIVFTIPTNDAKSMCFGAFGYKWYVLRAGVVYEYDLSSPFSFVNPTLVGTHSQFAANNPVHISATKDGFVFTELEGTATAINSYQIDKTVDSRATRSIARYVAYTLWQRHRDNVVNMVNWDVMESLEATWETRGDTFDAEFSDETTSWEAIKTALYTGYAEPTEVDGLFTPVRVTSGTSYQQMYTPDVMTDELSYSSPVYDGVESGGKIVEFYNNEISNNDTVEFLAYKDTGINPSRMQLIGATDPNKAYRLGARVRNRERFRPGSISFSTELDALNSNYGEPISIASDMWLSQYGEVMNYSAATLIITLSFAPDFTLGQTHFLALRNPDGSTNLLECAQRTSNQVQLYRAPSFVPVYDDENESTLVTFGTADEVHKRAIVREITKASETTVRVVAEEYLDEVYQDDDSLAGGQPSIAFEQVINYNEFRTDEAFIGYVKAVAGRNFQSWDIYFSNGTKTSDDGFYEIDTNTASVGKILITASGVANLPRNSFDTLPNTFTYEFITIYTGGQSDPVPVTFKVNDTEVPPERTLFYFPMENPPAGTTYDYQNKTYEMTFDPSLWQSVDGWANYGYGYNSNLQYGTFFFTDEIKTQKTGTWWFSVNVETSSSDTFTFEYFYDGLTSERIEFEYRSDTGTATINIDAGGNSYTATATTGGAASGRVLFAFRSNGSSHELFNYPDTFGSTTFTGSASLQGAWFDDINSSAFFRRLYTDGSSSLMTHGYSEKVLTDGELTKLAQFVTAGD